MKYSLLLRVKNLAKFAVHLDSKIFQNVKTIILHENPYFVYAMTYLCFNYNSFVWKSMCVIGWNEIYSVTEVLGEFYLLTMHNMCVYMHLVCHIKCSNHKFKSKS